MPRSRYTLLVLFCTGLAMSVMACAQQVGDIDRTQANRILKSDLDGTWYMLETVTDVPSTSAATFIGETSSTEKIRWVIEEDYLFAYRAYPRFPGSDNLDGNFDYNEIDYTESPVAAFSISSHFDIQRQYNSSTGEQTNVIVENSSDRMWYERDYIRVDWSRNHISNFDFISEWLPTPIEMTFTFDEERGEDRSLYFERDEDDQLVYFDLPRRLVVEPDLWGCAMSWTWYAYGTEDCTAAEIEVVTSFARTEPRRDYEPLPYNDHMMNRFGYFRSERYTYDSERGVLESGRSKMIQRHNIWQQNYFHLDNGDFLLNDDGQMVPIPLAERQVRTIPYYMNDDFPEDETITQATMELIDEWNLYAREGVAQAQDIALDQVPDVFVGCRNPVTADDHEACGEVGFVAREGDLRYSMIWWVNSEQQEGPLGYGPCAADPETGEILSGKAHIYGAGINYYASYALDVIMFMNGDLDPAELVQAEHVREMVRQRAEGATNLGLIAPELEDVPLGAWREQEHERLELREQRRREPQPFDRIAVQNRLERARDAGLSSRVAGPEFQQALAANLDIPVDELTPELLTQYDPTLWMNPTTISAMNRQRMRAIADRVDYADVFDPNIAGIAEAYAGRTDYDEIWRELRRDIYYSTAIHEVGHTVGLRHNFQGSYDSMNYFDEYWELRTENFIEPENMADLFELAAVTDAQITGRMREQQYSSIMDYGLAFNTDLQGTGKYDRAAIVFGYTGGTYAIPMDQLDGECSGSGRIVDPDVPNSCLVRSPGYVEVYAKGANDLGEAGDILTSQDEFGQYFDDPTSLIVPYLERWHYSTVMHAFPQMADAFDRNWMRLDQFLEAREAGGQNMPVRVPYLFCSDEWYEGLISCNVFDGGADPYEQTMNLVYDYHTYYYFRDFKRDRLGWWPGRAMWSYYLYLFLPASNYFQNWYLAPQDIDPVLDDYYWLSIHAGMNMLFEALATPSYGTYCTQPDGQLFHLSEDPGQSREETSDYYLDAYCDTTEPFFNVPQGQGRRRFTAYDLDAGYNFGAYPQEVGHTWTSMAAIWALTDPEAFVIGAEGDVGTYSISHIDFFGEEIFGLVNSMLTENYPVHSPVLEITGREGPLQTGVLHYPVLAPAYDFDGGGYVDPATGQNPAGVLGPSRATTALCQECVLSSECNGYTGGGYGQGAPYCVRGVNSENTDQGYCILDCENQPSGFCPDGYYCSPSTWCLPEEGNVCEDLVSACSDDNHNGTCPEGQTCEDGECLDLWPIVQSDTSLSQVDDWMFWGMLYSTFGWETRFNDQINVFKMGTREEQVPGPGFEVVTFTDPILGNEYGAIREDCSVETIEGGPTGICGECETHEDCNGWIGLYYGGTFCIELEGVGVCLQDCDQDATLCDADALTGYSCNAVSDPTFPGNYCTPDPAVPEDPSVCPEEEPVCSMTALRGTCDEGSTCVEGVCLELQGPSALCQVGWSEVPGGAQMILRGQEMVEEMNENLMAWAEYQGNDEAQDDYLYRQYSRVKYGVEWVMMELNTIRAVYEIFGMVY